MLDSGPFQHVPDYRSAMAVPHEVVRNPLFFKGLDKFQQIGSGFASRTFAVFTRPMKYHCVGGDFDIPRQSRLQLTRRGASSLPPFVPSVLLGTCERTMDQDHDGWLVGCLGGIESSSWLHSAVSLILGESRCFLPMSQDQFFMGIGKSL